jgi:hypothetical protein
MLLWILKTKIIDVGTAVFCRDLKEEIFMEITEGIDSSKEEFYL